MCKALLRRIKGNPLGRIKQFLLISLILNGAYSGFLLTISLLYSSRWFLVMSVYYGLLAGVRIVIYRQIYPQKDATAKVKRIRICGYFLLILNLVVSTMMFLIIYGNHFVKHHEITVITLAAYTFISLTMAIIGGVKYLRKNDCVYSCAIMVTLISASISLVTLTNTMLATFGGDASLRAVILPFLSGAVSIFIIIGAIFIICKTTITLRVLKNEQERE